MLTQDDVEPTVAVEVAQGRAAGELVARRESPRQGIARSGRLAESTVAGVQEDDVRCVATREEEVGPTVAVEVAGSHAETAKLVGKPRVLRRILEAKIALVAKEPRAPLRAIGMILSDGEIEETVAVEIEHRDASTLEPLRREPGARRDLDEASFAIVSKEPIRGIRSGRAAILRHVRDVEVDVAVVVEIGEDRAARAAQQTKDLVARRLERPLAVEKKDRGLRVIAGEGPHPEIEPTVAVDIAPSGGVTADPGEVLANPGLDAHIAKEKASIGLVRRGELRAGDEKERQAKRSHEPPDRANHGRSAEGI